MVEEVVVPRAVLPAPEDEPGGCCFIRRLRSTERDACDAFFGRLHRHDVLWRFGGPRSSGACLLPGRVASRRSLAFAAASSSGEILGILNIEYLDPVTAEIALIVRSDLKRRGIGSALLAHMMTWAQTAGLKRLVGHVLAENRIMLRLAIAAGFRRAGGDQVLVELSWPAQTTF
jgi:acetyltransferase